MMVPFCIGNFPVRVVGMHLGGLRSRWRLQSRRAKPAVIRRKIGSYVNDKVRGSAASNVCTNSSLVVLDLITACGLPYEDLQLAGLPILRASASLGPTDACLTLSETNLD